MCIYIYIYELPLKGPYFNNIINIINKLFNQNVNFLIFFYVFGVQGWFKKHPGGHTAPPGLNMRPWGATATRVVTVFIFSIFQ